MGGRAPSWPHPSLSPRAQYGPLLPRGVPVTPPALRYYPKPLGTIPMSEHSHPIYQSLCLDHSETPRHVRDLIRDSELLRYIKMHKLIITVIVTISMRTLRFENNVDMTETRLRSITNSGTWMPILAPTYSTKIFYRSNRIATYVVPFFIGMLLARDSIVGIQYLVHSRYRQVSLLVL